MPRGTQKKYEEQNKLQRQEDEKQIKRLLKKRSLEPEWESWSMVDNAKEDYRKAMQEGATAEQMAEAGRRLNTARMLYKEIGGYTCQAAEAKERLRKILKIMEEENLPAEKAISRQRNRKMRAADYKFNGNAREWYKPKES